MIEVSRIKNQQGNTIGFQCKGHAGFARHGKDIVCAAVSALVVNTVNSIEEFTEDKFSYAQEEKSGLAEFIITSDVSKEASLLTSEVIINSANPDFSSCA